MSISGNNKYLFFVIVVEAYIIFLLTSDNSIMHRDHTKYVTVRNWSLIEDEIATINKFDYVDFIFSDAKFHDENIKALNETIRMKSDVMMEKNVSSRPSASNTIASTLYKNWRTILSG